MGMPSGTELLIIFGIIVLLFGAKKIPDLAKSLGKGIKGFKAEMKEEDAVASEDPKKVEGSEEVASTTTTETPKTTTQA
ncbi:MAG: twin-arginine translocase TatA/TatE family subunit [Campylobacterota bacterium]|nr:twin-arginine translocase TatA/TatE family subunit [Campylobacterota bacterium]